MNFKKLRLNETTFVLVNFDNVTEIYERVKGGCDIYFNTMAASEDQAYIQVIESMSEIELIINSKDNK